VPPELIFAAGAAGTTALALLARHERRLVKARRGAILDPVLGQFRDAEQKFDGAGIPSLDGYYGGQHLHIELIPDTMTIRRLPQLWVSVTALQPIGRAAGAGLAILVRPSGSDYYSLTERMHHRLDLPVGFPWECLLRGEGEAAQATLAAIAPVAADVLADPKVKEIAVTSRGVRLIYQLAEGKRGHHLLLRQSDFEGASLEPQLLENIADALERLTKALVQDGRADV